MSVLIKGMEMPKNCKECPFSDHEAWCLIPGDWRERYYCPDDERSDDCQLIEVPPHGRLVDLDKMIDHFWDGNSMEVFKSELEQIQTVIEAEEGE